MYDSFMDRRIVGGIVRIIMIVEEQVTKGFWALNVEEKHSEQIFFNVFGRALVHSRNDRFV